MSPKELPYLLLAVGRHQNADAVAKFQREVGRRNDVGVVTPDMQELNRECGRQRQLRERHADDIGLADKDPNVIERRTVLDDAAGLKLPS